MSARELPQPVDAAQSTARLYEELRRLRAYVDGLVQTDRAQRNTDAVFLVPTGVMMPFGAAAAPSGWLLCNGAAVTRTGATAALFAVLGTAWGVGDGTTTFNLPDMRGRVPVGQGGGTAGALGAYGGEEQHTLSSAEMPVHTHTQNSHNHTGFVGDANGFTPDVFGSNVAAGPIGFYNRGTVQKLTIPPDTAVNQNAGSGGAHNNMQPYTLAAWIIKT